jgi:hypothetical protein
MASAANAFAVSQTASWASASLQPGAANPPRTVHASVSAANNVLAMLLDISEV